MAPFHLNMTRLRLRLRQTSAAGETLAVSVCAVWFCLVSAALYASSFFRDTWTPAVTHSQASLSAALYASSFFHDTWTPAVTHSQASLSAALYMSSFFCDTWTPADTHSRASLSTGFLPPNPDIIAHPVPVADVFVDSNPPCDVSDFTPCACC